MITTLVLILYHYALMWVQMRVCVCVCVHARLAACAVHAAGLGWVRSRPGAGWLVGFGGARVCVRRKGTRREDVCVGAVRCVGDAVRGGQRTLEMLAVCRCC